MKRSMSRTLDKIYRLVKEYKNVDIVMFCNKLDFSPSTFYNYRKFVLDRYVNIIYEDNAFKWIESEDDIPEQPEPEKIPAEPEKIPAEPVTFSQI